MSEPIGRKSIRKSIEKLKAHVTFKIEEFGKTHNDLNYLMDLFDKRHKGDKDDAVVSVAVSVYDDLARDTVAILSIYIEMLESYLSELDETFDKILEEARKMAEKQIKEMPKERPKFYG